MTMTYKIDHLIGQEHDFIIFKCYFTCKHVAGQVPVEFSITVRIKNQHMSIKLNYLKHCTDGNNLLYM